MRYLMLFLLAVAAFTAQGCAPDSPDNGDPGNTVVPNNGDAITADHSAAAAFDDIPAATIQAVHPSPAWRGDPVIFTI